MDLFNDDIVKRVLTFIPTPDLCRYRTVSKGWNDLISNLNFALEHAQNHAYCQDASFIVLHYIRRNVPSIFGWCIVDENARLWYRIMGIRHRDVLSEPDIPVAMDGGLVCQLLETESDDLETESNDHISLIVHNPIGDYFEILPPVPKHETSEDCPRLSLVFDTIAKTFQAFVINHHYNKTSKLEDPSTSEEERLWIRNDPMVRVYDSARKEWQSLSNPDWDVSGVGRIIGSVTFQDQLLVLFSFRDTDSDLDTHPGRRNYPLLSFSFAEKKWDSLCSIIENSYDPKLVVTDNRLFLVSWCRKKNQTLWWFCLEEIKISEMTRELVCEFSKEQLWSFFDIRSCVARLDRRPPMSVIGFGNSSLMLMSNSSGKCRVLDVVTLSWHAHALPPNPLSHLPHGRECEWVGKHMNLLLPNWELSTD